LHDGEVLVLASLEGSARGHSVPGWLSQSSKGRDVPLAWPGAVAVNGHIH